MRKQDKKEKSILPRIISAAIFILMGGVCGFLAAKYTGSVSGEEKPFYDIILTFAVLLISLFFQIIIHETGHLVFGLISGYKFCSFRILSFMWLKENGKIKFKRLSVAGMGGQCLMAPPEIKDGKIPVILYNLGGSLMNTITGLLFLGLSFAISDTTHFSDMLLMLAIMGFACAVLNGVPMHTASIDNDGYNAFSINRNQKAMRSFWIQLKTNEQITNGVKLREMPDEWFAIPSDEDMKNSINAVIGIFACNRLMVEHRFEEADKLMAHMLEIDSGIVGLHRSLTICDRMYVELITENRRETLDSMLTKDQKRFMIQMKNYPSVLRTQYAYALLCEKDRQKADKILMQFKKIAKSYPYESDMQSEYELIEIAQKKAEIIS